MLSVILIYLVLIINNTFAIECLNYTQCQDTKIDEEALCYGYKSCWSQQTRIESNSSVECAGGESCSMARILANDSITCSGAKGCLRARYIASQYSDVKCSGWFGCSHSEINAANGRVSCSGPHSCFSSDLDFVGVAGISCFGSKSCQQTFVDSADDGLCDGDQSCAIINFEGPNLYCRAIQSCEKPNYIKTDKIYAYGMKSLNTAKAQKINAREIDAMGYLSLLKASFDTKDPIDGQVFDLTINMLGLSSGFNADIQCRAGSICTLNCYGNGCEGTTLYCLDGSQCIVTPSDCVINGISADISESTWAICPDIEISASEQHDQLLLNRFAALSEEKDISDNKGIDDYDTEDDDDDDNDEIGDYLMADVFDFKECDDILECKGRVFNSSDADAICTGYLACSHAYFNFDDDIQCYGYKSCINALQIYTSGDRTDNSAFGHGTGKGYIKCMSEESCFNAKNISAPATISCFGKNSCAFAGLIESRRGMIMCDGSYACQNSTIIAATKTKCVSTRSCYNSYISGRVIVCNGPQSCSFANMTSNVNVVKCDGMRSCTDSVILANFVRAYSFYDTINARIMTKTINGYGFGSLAFSRIEPISENDLLRVFSHGYNSGYGTEVICRSGRRCQLDCKYNGCNNTYFTCYYGSTCRVTINDQVISQQCGFISTNESLSYSLHNITTVNGTICPKWVYDKESVIGDHQLDQYIKLRKENRKNDVIYQQIINEVTVKVDDDSHNDNDDNFVLVDSIKIENYGKEEREGQRNKYFSFDKHGMIIMIIIGSLIISLCLMIYKYMKENNKNDNFEKTLQGEYQPLLI